MAKKYVTAADITRLPRDWEECLLMRKQSQDMKLASALDDATRDPITEEEIDANGVKGCIGRFPSSFIG